MKIIKTITEKPIDRYIAKYGKHFSINLADYASKQMINADSTNSHWYADEIKNIIKELGYTIPLSSTIGDIVYTTNMARADFYPSLLKDIKSCVIYAIKIANDKDGYEGIQFCRWLADIENKNLQIDWISFV